MPPSRFWPGLALGALAAGFTGTGSAGASDWRLAQAVIAEDCRAPLVTYFSTQDGRQIEANRLDFTAERIVWMQRAFYYSDGAPVYESELSLGRWWG